MRLLSVLAVLASNVALSQIYIGPGGVGVGVPAPVPVVVGQANYPISYQPHPQGFTQIQVVAPAGVQIVVYDGYAMVGNGYGTVVAGAYPGRFYRVDFVNPDGTRWEQTVAAQAGMIASVGVVPQGPPPPPPPQPVYAPPPAAVAPPPPAQMAPGDFASLQNAINQAAFPRDKIAVLATAAGGAYFSCGQVGRLIDLYAFPEDKVRVARIVRDHIVDPGNEYTLYAHYAFPDDREKVRHILMRQ